MAGDSFLTDNSSEYLELLHLSITTNRLSNEETIENLLGVFPHQFELVFDSNSLENYNVCVCACARLHACHSDTYEVHTRHSSIS